MRQPLSLTVIVGAGAPHDCVDPDVTDFDGDYLPPLTDRLFDFRASFNGILNKYRRAEALADFIRTKVSQKASLEAVLQLLEAEENLSVKRQYWEIPLYLQELFGEISARFIRTGSSKIDTLVWEIERSRYRRVMYLTLNYDLFLENALSCLYGVKFADLVSYCRDDHKWDLVKLHGSVNWGRKLLTPHQNMSSAVGVLGSLATDLDLDKDIVFLKSHQDKHRFTDNGFCYPALAIPLGRKKQPVCHPSHVERARAFLRDCRDFLVIGCSALDEDLLDLLREVEHVGKFLVVSRGIRAANETIGRISSANQRFPKEAVYPDQGHSFDGGFNKFVASGQLAAFLSRRE